MSGKKYLTERVYRMPGRRAVWEAVRLLRCFTRSHLRRAAPRVKPEAVHRYLAALIRGGYVKPGPMVADPNGGRRKVRSYDLIRDVGVDAPRLLRDGTELPPTAQERMWMQMKINKSFSLAGLMYAASLDAPPVAEFTAADYIRHLVKAGYLVASGGEGKETVYRLINNTGGHPPLIQRTKVVYDPNLDKIMWHEEVEP
jgi:hypothetical protein